jgi:peptide/nickel transport system substrate-binding protein
MRRTRVAVAVVGLTAVLAAVGCSANGGQKTKESSPGFAECDSKPNACNSGPTKKGGTFVVVIEKTLPNWNIIDSDGATFETAQVMTAVAPAPFPIEPDSSVKWNNDLFAEEPKQTSTSPQTVVMKLRPEAVWNDGTPITYKDFEFYWRTSNTRDCKTCTPAVTSGYDLITSITGSDNDKTVTLTFSDAFPDWRSLFTNLYPAHVAAKYGDLKTPEGLQAAFEGFKTNVPTWSGGAYKISEQEKEVSVTMVPNERWYGKTKPALDKLIFRIVEDQAQQIPALKNKEAHALTSQPNADMVSQVQAMAGVNYYLAKGPTWEHTDLNLTNRWLKDPALRKAIFTAVDRKTIIAKTVGTFFKAAAPLNNHNFMPGTKGDKDVVSATGQGTGDINKARKILTDAGYRIDGGKLFTKDGQQVAPLRFRFTTGNQLRQQTGALIQAQLKELGIELKLEPTDKLGTTLTSGDFDMIIYAWVGSSFLADKKDLWTTGGGGNYGKYSNPDVDKLIGDAVKTFDDKQAREMFNRADEIMSADAYNLPLFQKPVFLAVYSDYVNVRNNPTAAGPAYNCNEWGLKQ